MQELWGACCTPVGEGFSLQKAALWLGAGDFLGEHVGGASMGWSLQSCTRQPEVRRCSQVQVHSWVGGDKGFGLRMDRCSDSIVSLLPMYQVSD